MGEISKLMQDFKDRKTFGQLFLDQYNETILNIRTKIENTPNPQEAEASKDKFYIRPSSLGQCARQIYYSKLDEARDPVDTASEWTYNIHGILEAGTDRHERIQAVLQEMEVEGKLTNIDIEEHCDTLENTKFLFWNEDKTEARCLNEEHDIFFQPDGLVNWQGKTCLFEIKTCSSYKLRKVMKDDKPFPEHLLQATAYALSLNVDYVIFFYEGREFCRRYPILIEITPAMKQEVIDRISYIRECLENKELPDREDKCRYCKYTEKCLADMENKSEEIKF